VGGRWRAHTPIPRLEEPAFSSWRTHARIGVPVTLLTLAVAAGWLWMRSI